jgi:DNA mismatch endonuclease (patch repair protein)
MSSIRSKNTKPEIAVRKTLWAKGFRYRVHYGPEKIDIAFPSKKVGIFIDGCFWHGCPIHSHEPKTNQAYWLPKLQRNIQRDFETNEQLKAKGWAVIRFWEHDIKNMSDLVEKIERELHSIP